MTSSRCYTRRVGRDSLNLPGRGKWTSTSPVLTFCVIGPAMPDQHRQTNRLDRRMRIGAAQRELSRNNFLAPGYACVTPADWLHRYHDTVLREPPFGTRETTGCRGLEKSARAQPRTRFTWSAFGTTRGRLNSLFPRRATRLRREPYETLGACKFTSPACFLGGPNVTWKSLEARPWPVDFQATVAPR